MKQIRNQFIDIMRGIAMLLVVLGHTMTGCITGAEESFLYNIVWSLQMPMFILISGYVTRYSREITDIAGLWKYMKRRTIAYLLPWIVWSFIVLGVIFGESTFLDIKWLLWHMDSGYWFLATIWTISMIFGVSIFVAKKLAQNSEIKQQVFTLFLYVVGMAFLVGVGLITGLSFFAIKLTLYYMPFYFAGYLYGQYRDKIFEKKWGKTTVDVVVAICLAVWLFIMTRYHLYALPDSGMAIFLRAGSSVTGCVAVCGLCKGLFAGDVQSELGGTARVVRRSFAGDLSRPLSAALSAEDGRDTFNGKLTGHYADDKQLHNDSGANTPCSQVYKLEQGFKTGAIWKQRIGNGFLWAGKKSLEIYMFHGLLLDVLKPQLRPVFPSISGYVLIMGNFVVTIILCVVVISLISQNGISKKILGMK